MNAKKLKQKVLQLAFSGVLTGDDASGWERCTLGEVCKYSDEKISFHELDETNYVGVDNLLKGKQGKKDTRFAPSSENQTKFEVGDILLGNIRPYLKKLWIADVDGGASGDVLCLKPFETIKSDFLYYIVYDDDFFDYNTLYSKGVNMPRGNKNKIMEYELILPPLPTQHRIVTAIKNAFAVLDEIERNLI